MRSMIISPEVNSRQRLRQALGALGTGWQVRHAPDFSRARDEIQQCGTLNIVFISEAFGSEDIRNFIKFEKERAELRDCAFVLIAQAGAMSLRLAAASLVGEGGVDGFLVEPFSVEGLRATVILAERIRRERTLARERIAYRLLVRELAEQLNAVWNLKRRGYPANHSLKLLRETCAVLNELSLECRGRFHETLILEFSSIEHPRALPDGNALISASPRVRGRAEQRLVETRSLEAYRARLALQEVA